MIHDLVPLHHPEWVHARTHRMHGAKYRHAAEACDVVIVNSRFTGDDVAATLGVDRARIHVAYPGVEPGFSAGGERFEVAGGRPYALAVATLEPRKNFARLVEAYRLLDPAELSLVVVGAAGWGDQPELDAPGIVRLGYTSRDELPRLYRGASAFVYPSLFEGFGMPVAEAMACGTPCVVSSHPSLDEACGDAAVRVDPDDPAAIAAGIERALGGARRPRVAWPRARAAVHVARQRPRASRRVAGCGVNVAVDVTALAQTRAGTARYLRALLPRLERDVSLRRVSGYARGAPGTLWLDLAWYPHVLSHKARGADVLHCPTYRGPVRGGVAAGGRDGARRRRVPSSGGLSALDARVQHAASSRACSATRAASSPCRSSPPASSSPCCACRARRSASCRTPSTRSSRPTDRARTATTSSRSERSSRARISRASSRRRSGSASSCASRARAAGGTSRRAATASRGSARSVTTSSRGCIAARSASRIRRSTRASGSRSREAMGCGAPVVTSAGGATEEVAGGAAVLVDPLDPVAIAAGIEDAIARRDELRARGIERARAFSWDDAARDTLEVYREAAA